jgi:hypothetical protein
VPIPPPDDAPFEVWLRYLEEARKAGHAVRAPESVMRRLLTQPPPPGGGTLRWLARGGVYGALAYLFVAAVVDHFHKLPQGGGGSGPCDTSVKPVPISASRSATGPKGALDKAYQDLDAQCMGAGLKCKTTTCPTCGPDVAVQTVDVSSRVFWYTADVTGICQCWCK